MKGNQAVSQQHDHLTSENNEQSFSIVRNRRTIFVKKQDDHKKMPTETSNIVVWKMSKLVLGNAA